MLETHHLRSREVVSEQRSKGADVGGGRGSMCRAPLIAACFFSYPAPQEGRSYRRTLRLLPLPLSKSYTPDQYDTHHLRLISAHFWAPLDPPGTMTMIVAFGAARSAPRRT